VYALVRGLFFSLLPALLDRVANDKPLSDRQADQVIALMEDKFREALELADNGLEHDDQAVSSMFSHWSSEILQCMNGGR